jgi:hypothetical protein
VSESTQELRDALARVRERGLKVYVYDDDGMRYSLVVARDEGEARRKAKGGRTDEWDDDHDGLLELNGEPL